MKTEIGFTFTLSCKEARWLKSVVQNSVSNYESVEDGEIRRTFWEALPSFEDLDKLNTLQKQNVTD